MSFEQQEQKKDGIDRVVGQRIFEFTAGSEILDQAADITVVREIREDARKQPVVTPEVVENQPQTQMAAFTVEQSANPLQEASQNVLAAMKDVDQANLVAEKLRTLGDLNVN